MLRSWMTPDARQGIMQDQDLTNEQVEYLMASLERHEHSPFSKWMSESAENDGVSAEILRAKAEELCVEARRRAGWEIPEEFYEPYEVVTTGTGSVVRWMGVSVLWFLGVFMKIPEMQYLLVWDCPLWFVRNFCITVILRLRGVTSGSVVDHIDKFPTTVEATYNVTSVSPNEIKFVSYTGACPLSKFLKYMEDEQLKNAHIWSDILSVCQFGWRERHDNEMIAFKEDFMLQLRDWIGKVSAVALLVDCWEDLTTTLGQIWVLWELYSSTLGNAKLFVLFLDSKEKRFVEESFGSQEGFLRIFSTRAKIDARNAKAYNKEDKELILRLMQKEPNGIFNVSKKVAMLFRGWLAKTGMAIYEESDRRDSATLPGILATLFCDMGRHGEAVSLYKTRLEFCRKAHGNKHPDTLSSISDVASLLKEQGKLEEAKPFYKEALEGQRESLGNKHPDTLTSINSMGRLLLDQGKLDEAEPFYKEALEGRREVLGNKHPATLWSINDMANLLSDKGQLEEAEPLYKEALEGRRELLGNKHPDTLTSINNMANLLKKQGKLDEAEPLCREALEGMLEMLDIKHPTTLMSIKNMADLYHSQGKLEEAEPLYKEALEGRRKWLGNKHPDTLSSIDDMAILLSDQGKLKAAKPLYKEALEGRREVLGNKHRDTLSSINSMAVFLKKQGKLEEAETFYKEALEGRRELLGNKHPDTLTSINNMANLLSVQGKLVEAEPFHKEALEGKRELLGNKHPGTLVSILNMATFQFDLGNLNDAQTLCAEAKQGCLELLGPHHPYTKHAVAFEMRLAFASAG